LAVQKHNVILSYNSIHIPLMFRPATAGIHPFLSFNAVPKFLVVPVAKHQVCVFAVTKRLQTVTVLHAHCRPHGDYTNANMLWQCQLLRQSRRHNRLRRGHCPRNQITTVDLYKRRKRTHGRLCQTCPLPISLHVLQAIIRTHSSLRAVDHPSISLKLSLWLRFTLCLIELSRALISISLPHASRVHLSW